MPSEDEDIMDEKEATPSFYTRMSHHLNSPVFAQALRPNILLKHVKLLSVTATLVFIFLCWDRLTGSLGRLSKSHQPHGAADINPIYNNTLGFQAIYALVLPDRKDRLKPLLATANATNITLTVLDAVRDKEIPSRDIPDKWATDGNNPEEGQLGCMMSHVLTWRMMIRENINTALIMESDVDWDMRIKRSMQGFSEGAKVIADEAFRPEIREIGEGSKHPRNFTTPPSIDLSPYGDNWDILWIGHCGANGNGDGRYYAYHDPSAAAGVHAWEYSPGPGGSYPRPGNTRLVFQLAQIVCTSAYAISNRGARKMESHFHEANQPVDIRMWDQCHWDPELVCVTTFPQIISVAESKSNIKHTAGFAFGKVIEEEEVKPGMGIQISARMNAYLGVAGQGPRKWRKEWNDEVGEGEGDGEREEDDYIGEDDGKILNDFSELSS